MHHKFEALEKFKEYKTEVDNLLEKKLLKHFDQIEVESIWT